MHLVTEGERGRFEFEPPLLLVEPGDSVRFVPDDHMHGVKSVAGMLPEGAAPWRGRMGDELVVKLDQPGVYGVKCPSGYKVGMVGLIVVGDDPGNWELARAVRHPPEPSRAFDALFDAADLRAGAPHGLHGLAAQPQWRPLAPIATVSSPSTRLMATTLRMVPSWRPASSSAPPATAF